MRAVLLSLAAVAVSAKTCGSYYTDDKCTAKATKADDCFPTDECFKMGTINAKATCSGDSLKLKVFLTADCSDAGTDSTPEKVNTCLPHTDPVDATIKAKIIMCTACFSTDDTAELESGKIVKLSELAVGDRVLALDADGSLTFSPVFRFGYSTLAAQSFRRFTTEGGHTLEVTAGHHIFANTCCSLDASVSSETIQVGDSLFVREGKALVSRKVTSIETVVKAGAINPHTVHGTIVVNGIAATHFTFETTWNYRSLAPYWYGLVHAFSTVW